MVEVVLRFSLGSGLGGAVFSLRGGDR